MDISLVKRGTHQLVWCTTLKCINIYIEIQFTAENSTQAHQGKSFRWKSSFVTLCEQEKKRNIKYQLDRGQMDLEWQACKKKVGWYSHPRWWAYIFTKCTYERSGPDELTCDCCRKLSMWYCSVELLLYQGQLNYSNRYVFNLFDQLSVRLRI